MAVNSQIRAWRIASYAAIGALSLVATSALAEDTQDAIQLPKTEGVSLHLQSTFIPEGYLPFHVGPDDPASGNGVSADTWTVTGYFGMRLWESTEVYFNPEMYQGYLLRDFLRVTSPSPQALATAKPRKAAPGLRNLTSHDFMLARHSVSAASRRKSRTISTRSQAKRMYRALH